MTPQEEERRGAEAGQILNNPLYKEAYSAIRDRILAQLSLADYPDEARKRCNDLLIALAKVDGYLRQVMVSGEMAALETERKRTFAERMGIRRTA